MQTNWWEKKAFKWVFIYRQTQTFVVSSNNSPQLNRTCIKNVAADIRSRDNTIIKPARAFLQWQWNIRRCSRVSFDGRVSLAALINSDEIAINYETWMRICYLFLFDPALIRFVSPRCLSVSLFPFMSAIEQEVTKIPAARRVSYVTGYARVREDENTCPATIWYRVPLNSASKPSTPFIAFAGGSYANGRETLRATKTRGEHGAARDTEKGNKWEVKSEERERKEERQERRQREKERRRVKGAGGGR